MDRDKQNLRREAAKAFMDSLDQLGNVLASDTLEASGKASRAPSNKSPERPPASATPIDADAFDRAAADIEAFMQKVPEANS